MPIEAEDVEEARYAPDATLQEWPVAFRGVTWREYRALTDDRDRVLVEIMETRERMTKEWNHRSQSWTCFPKRAASHIALRTRRTRERKKIDVQWKRTQQCMHLCTLCAIPSCSPRRLMERATAGARDIQICDVWRPHPGADCRSFLCYSNP